MGGNRKHGFMRGNASGRNGFGTPKKWFCTGCEREHGGRVNRTKLGEADYCDRKYLALKAKQFAEQKQATAQRPATPTTMQEWRDANPDPAHGCGHMQGRGAA